MRSLLKNINFRMKEIAVRSEKLSGYYDKKNMALCVLSGECLHCFKRDLLFSEKKNNLNKDFYRLFLKGYFNYLYKNRVRIFYISGDEYYIMWCEAISLSLHEELYNLLKQEAEVNVDVYLELISDLSSYFSLYSNIYDLLEALSKK